MTTSYSFEHLFRMSDQIGLFEHAEFDTPRQAHGYCVDDVARGLIVIAREPEPSPELLALADVYLRFLTAAIADDGRVRNRCNTAGHWTDEATVEDCWGRALWGLGSVVAHIPRERDRALALFNLCVGQRSPSLHAMLFAALGAAEVLATVPDHAHVRALLRAAANSMRIPSSDSAWPWPEWRLRYANGAIPQVLLLAGSLLDVPKWANDGIRLLDWLVEIETVDGHISVTPVDGWQPGEVRPGFDQQPIEVAALADACGTAFALTADPHWLHTIHRCVDWFDGVNDAGIVMADRSRGSGFDGLQNNGRNENQGAESTLAMLTTLQLFERMPVHV